MSAYRNHRKILGEQRGNSVNTAEVIDYSNYVERVASAVALGAARVAGGVKAVARAANMNERTVENVMNRRSGPNGWTLIQLARAIPELKAEIRQLLELDAALDPDVERHISGLISAYQRRGNSQVSPHAE